MCIVTSHTCMSQAKCVYIYVCMNIYVCIYIYMYRSHLYTYIYIYICIYTWSHPTRAWVRSHLMNKAYNSYTDTHHTYIHIICVYIYTHHACILYTHIYIYVSGQTWCIRHFTPLQLGHRFLSVGARIQVTQMHCVMSPTKESCHTDERILMNEYCHTFAIRASKFLLCRFESEGLIALRARVRFRATGLLHVAACLLNGCVDEQACVCVGEFVLTSVRFVWLFVYVTSACFHLRVAIYRSMSSCPICILMHA